MSYNEQIISDNERQASINTANEALLQDMKSSEDFFDTCDSAAHLAQRSNVDCRLEYRLPATLKRRQIETSEYQVWFDLGMRP